ncbi:MAG: hypothetical protein ACK5OB_15825 [Pirellula sp.]
MGIALICGIGFSGCRQRAFTELYAESLAREIREVEDLVYEFDAENRAMEYEIHDLRRTNAQLKARLEELQSERARLGTAGPNASGPVLERKPRTDDASPNESKRNPSTKQNKGAAGPEGNVPSSLLKTPPPLTLPAVNDSDPTSMPEIVVPKKGPPPLSSNGLGDGTNTPRPKNSAEPIVAPKSDEAATPQDKNLPKSVPSEERERDKQIPDASTLELPKIEIPKLGNPAAPINPNGPSASLPQAPASELLPPGDKKSLPVKEPLLKPAPKGLPDEVSDAVLRERKIYTPDRDQVLQASSQSIASSSTSEPSAPPATKAVYVTKIDPRIREIEFHPTLTRGHNFDGKRGDDGLYLVLLPRNSQHQFVPGNGTLTVVAEETQSDGTTNRIGRWTITPEQWRDGLEPIGEAQGFHVKLPWQERIPNTSQVDVWVRFSLEDGTTMVNQRPISVRQASPGTSTWTPR